MIWKLLAKLLSQPAVVDWMIARAMKTPFTHILSQDKSEVYMYRYWLLNPYLTRDEKAQLRAEGKKLPYRFPISVRLHKIMVKDGDRHMHDHPWDARTIILRGWYDELRRVWYAGFDVPGFADDGLWEDVYFKRRAGDTATLKFNEYHRITKVPEEGVWTLFITYKYQGTWGFLKDGVKIPYKEYLK